MGVYLSAERGFKCTVREFAKLAPVSTNPSGIECQSLNFALANTWGMLMSEYLDIPG